jgi:LysR family carnitine catabolism transcriptional activator
VARALLADLDAAFADMGDFIARRKGRVAVAALPSLAAHGLPAVIAEYRRAWPGITVQLYDALSDQCLHLLRQGKVDVALTAPGASLAEFATRTLCSDPFYLVCRRDHALAKKRRIKVADLAGHERSTWPRPPACASMSTSSRAAWPCATLDWKSSTWPRWPG